MVGLLSGILGVGGGFILVPMLVALKYSALGAVGTSAFVVTMIAFSASLYNWKYSFLNWKHLVEMILPCLLASQLGVVTSVYMPPALLLFLFGLMLIVAVVLVYLENPSAGPEKPSTRKSLIIVGGTGGFFRVFLVLGVVSY